MSIEQEQINLYAQIAKRAMDSASTVVRSSWAKCERWRDGIAPNLLNRLGDDIDGDTLSDIEKLFAGKLGPVSAWREAQLRELAFWRWVAFEGYQNLIPDLFPLYQEHFMVSTYFRTGWSLQRFSRQAIFELGCGPLGMIEYIPGRRRVAFDPLNAHYSRLFAKCRSRDIQYCSRKEELASLSDKFEFVVCHNVIDHTDDPAWWFNTLFDMLKQDGDFLFQVNLTRREVPQSSEHMKMHPSPITREQILEWLAAQSTKFDYYEDKAPSADGEFYFMAWGKKTQSASVNYSNIARHPR